MATPAVSAPPCPTSPRLTPREPPRLQQDRFAHAVQQPRKTGAAAKPEALHGGKSASSSSSSSSSRRTSRQSQLQTRGRRRTASKAVSKTITTSTTSADADAPDDDTTVITDDRLTSFADVNRVLCTNPNLLRDAPALRHLCATLSSFLDANREVGSSPNLQTGAMDRLDRIVSLCFDLYEAIRHQEQRQQFVSNGGTDPIDTALHQLHVLILQVFKVLLRKQPNRAGLGAVGVRGLGMLASASKKTHVACEGSNAVLNMCYEACNVSLLVDEIGVAFLVRFLHSDDTTLQASAAGALQSICFQYMGRVACREEHAIQRLVQLMYSEDNTVCARVVGALHNLSSDPISLRPMREAGCLPGLVKLLGSCSPMA